MTLPPGEIDTSESSARDSFDSAKTLLPTRRGPQGLSRLSTSWQQACSVSRLATNAIAPPSAACHSAIADDTVWRVEHCLRVEGTPFGHGRCVMAHAAGRSAGRQPSPFQKSAAQELNGETQGVGAVESSQSMKLLQTSEHRATSCSESSRTSPLRHKFAASSHPKTSCL